MYGNSGTTRAKWAMINSSGPERAHWAKVHAILRNREPQGMPSLSRKAFIPHGIDVPYSSHITPRNVFSPGSDGTCEQCKKALEAHTLQKRFCPR